ncbi:methylated-DNA--[protein]-cysteine S-methyltransferase [uncultured Corynebacterium sp.]|uniref:methylated-DNA--[protein]-cysteine S-methyltransferase n=1 Tax=uncultured Corynebacterium sp. TaxID=159447 RepID=UPI00259A893B|nr:methylated-DNA--[protein]-cysteine S-methyltransferase [uncultured Corynebacterium sp.]
MSTLTWSTLATPIGELVLVHSELGLARVAFETEGVAREGEEAAYPEAEKQLGEYFAGRRREFDLPLDWRFSSGFRREAQRALLEIPYGETRSYAQVARSAGRPRAVRAVGTACATNPLPIVVPCHRVLRSDGSLGGYRGGPEAKRWLLELECASG